MLVEASTKLSEAGGELEELAEAFQAKFEAMSQQALDELVAIE
jgi:hypothetical protein